MDCIEVVKRFIDEQRLLAADSLHLVAVSGGADSVCLLLMLRQLGYRVEAVHCNFHLRGEESDRDEQFVVSLCKSTNVNLHISHFDTQTYARLHQVSIEMAARQLRYHYFRQLIADIGATDICVAHHRDDSVETMLLNLMRGTGIHGLCGIQPRRDHIVRPLLCLGRKDIVRWLDERGQTYVTDSTNLETDAQRNYIRLEIMPRLQQRWPAVGETLLNTARQLSETARVYDAAISRAIDSLIVDNRLSLSRLQQQPSAESILFEWLSPLGFASAVIRQIASRLPLLNEGRYWQSDSHELTVHQGCLLVSPLAAADRTILRIPEPGNYVYGDSEHFCVSEEPGAVIDTRSEVCCADADMVHFPLTIRPVQTGDRFQPLGMNGSRLVSDFLCDRKMARPDRRRQLAVFDSDGCIVWLCDLRPSHVCRVTDKTKKTLKVTHQTISRTEHTDQRITHRK